MSDVADVNYTVQKRKKITKIVPPRIWFFALTKLNLPDFFISGGTFVIALELLPWHTSKSL